MKTAFVGSDGPALRYSKSFLTAAILYSRFGEAMNVLSAMDGSGRGRFLKEIVRLSTAGEAFSFPLVAVGTFGCDGVVVLYREHVAGPVVGRSYEYENLVRLFRPSTAEIIADAIVVNELTEPSGEGVVLDLPWEPALIGSDERVHWHGDIRKIPSVFPQKVEF